MSMNSVTCLNHNPHHATNEKPMESPAVFTVRPSRYHCEVAFLVPLATVVEGAETHYICMT